MFSDNEESLKETFPRSFSRGFPRSRAHGACVQRWMLAVRSLSCRAPMSVMRLSDRRRIVREYPCRDYTPKPYRIHAPDRTRWGAAEVGRSTVTAGCTAEAYANRLDFARMAFLFVVKNGACEPRFPRRPTSARATMRAIFLAIPARAFDLLRLARRARARDRVTSSSSARSSKSSFSGLFAQKASVVLRSRVST